MTLRKPGQLAPMAAVVVIVLFTLAGAAANVIPIHHPSRAALLRADEQDLIVARRTRIAQRLVTGDHCDAELAHELARDLVYDGRSARGIADDFIHRCGDDEAMRHWANAPVHPWGKR